jgi:hypothetical protein
MSAASDLVVQFMGDQTKAKRGWLGLRPHAAPDGSVWSAFLNRTLEADEGQTLVEGVGAVLHEVSARIPVFRNGVKKDSKETTLGHAAAAHGTALDNAALTWEVREQNKKVLAQNQEIIGLLKSLGAK